MSPLFIPLRWRLTLTCVLLVALATSSMWWLSRTATLTTSSDIVESALTQLMGVIEGEVRAGHALTVQAKVNSLRFNHAYLWDEGMQCNTMLTLLQQRGGTQQDMMRFMRNWQKTPLKVGTRFALYEKIPNGIRDVLNGETIFCTETALASSPVNIVHKLPPDGLLAVFRNGQGVMSFGAFMPCTQADWTIVTYRELSTVEAESAQVSNAIMDRARQLISSVTILKSGYLAAVDGMGNIQAIHHKAPLPKVVLRAAANMDSRHLPRDITLDLPTGRMEYRITYIRPFDWRLIVAVPTRELEAPADMLTAQLIKIACGAMLLGLIAAFFMSSRIVHPLRRLAELAHRLPSENMLELDPRALSRSLPLQRKDEVGDLARSFSYMAGELHRNVTSLVEASAAKERLQAELNVARTIQEGILPKIFPPYPERHELDLFATSEPAKEVGGDLYDFFFVDKDKLCLVIGDVSDKGVPAALYMSITVTLVRVAMQEAGASPEEALERVNFNLASDSTRAMFVTLCIGVLDLADGTLLWASGGHPPPYVLRRDGLEQPAASGNLVVGAMPDMRYDLHRLQLAPGDALFFYTDGISEAMDADLHPYGEARLRSTLSSLSSGRMRQIIEGVRADMDTHMNGAPPSDDITMLAVRYMPAMKA